MTLRLGFATLGLMMTLNADDLRVTGRAMVVNGETEVPRGLFGVHATPVDDAKLERWGVENVRLMNQTPLQAANGLAELPAALPEVMECLWDRYQPAVIVQHADWAERLREAAQAAAVRAKASERLHIIEFWNEPYLNWGVRPGVNYDGAFYKDDFKLHEKMTLAYEEEATAHMVWTEQLVAVKAESGEVDYLATRYMPQGRKEGDSWTWREREYRAEKKPWGRDVTQSTFWPGKQNVLWYLAMLKEFAPAFKEQAPEIPLVMGWDFHIYQNQYAAWEDVHKPTLDAAAAWIDGYSEHHYGGDTRRVAASYSVAWSYMMQKHGKSIDFYNTEAGGDLDPERPGAADPGYNTTSPEVRDRAAFTYTVRDILHLLDKVPDKAKSRSAHEAHHNRGVPAAFLMMRDLRGTLMETLSPAEDIWVVSALNGNKLTVLVFNDSRGSIRKPLQVQAPGGSRIVGVTHLSYNRDEFVRSKPETLEAAENWIAEVKLQMRGCQGWVLDLEGEPKPDRVSLKQFVAEDGVLHEIPQEDALELSILLPEAELAVAQSGRLRIVQEGFDPNVHQMSFNGKPLELKPGGLGIVDAELPKEWLQESNLLRFTRNPGVNTARIQAASLFLLQEL